LQAISLLELLLLSHDWLEVFDKFIFMGLQALFSLFFRLLFIVDLFFAKHLGFHIGHYLSALFAKLFFERRLGIVGGHSIVIGLELLVELVKLNFKEFIAEAIQIALFVLEVMG